MSACLRSRYRNWQIVFVFWQMPKYIYYLYFIPLVMGALASLRSFRAPWAPFYRIFSLFLIGTLCTEIFAVSWKFWLHETRWWHLPKSNLWIYNLYYIPQYISYYYFFYKAMEKGTIKRSIFLLTSSIVVVGGLFNIFFIQGVRELDTYTIIIGSMGVIFFCFCYMRQEPQHQTRWVAIKEPLFWISTGALVFHMAALPYFVFINYLSKHDIKLALSLFMIILFVNIVMYTTYLISFICSRPYLQKQS